MKNAGENLNLQAFFQRSRDHLLRESSMKNVLYVDEAFVAEQGGSVTRNFLRTLLKGGLYLAAILVLPGALIGAPLLWWLGNRRKKSPQSTWKACS